MTGGRWPWFDRMHPDTKAVFVIAAVVGFWCLVIAVAVTLASG